MTDRAGARPGGYGGSGGRGLTLRPESKGDEAAIRDVTFAAFEGRPYADGDEHELVDRLRAADALALSLVAEKAGEVVGHVAFSPAAGGPGAWYALGPVSVLPAFQRRGIGSALIRAGLETLAARGARGCILVGDPNYYARFGFEGAPDLAPPREPAEYFMVKRLGGERPAGPMGFHAAFYG